MPSEETGRDTMSDVQRRTKAEIAAELARVRGLVQRARDALDAELTPNYEDGHDKAVAALTEALTGAAPSDPYKDAEPVDLRELERRSNAH